MKTTTPYPHTSTAENAYRQVSQWHEKEMHNLGKFLLGAVTDVLKNPKPAE